jgi:hypothetical protein
MLTITEILGIIFSFLILVYLITHTVKKIKLNDAELLRYFEEFNSFSIFPKKNVNVNRLRKQSYIELLFLIIGLTLLIIHIVSKV